MSNTVLLGNLSGVTTDSQGAGIIAEGASARMLHITIQANTGGDGSGVHAYFGSSFVLTNTILVNQAVGITVTADSAATLNGVLWHNNDADTGGAGAINITNEYTGTPAFSPDGYHLMDGSNAIDKGVEAGVTDDVDGQIRPYNDLPDLGADEWYSCTRLTDVDITGPTTGQTNTVYTFATVIFPPSATEPVTYTWANIGTESGVTVMPLVCYAACSVLTVRNPFLSSLQIS